MLTGITVTVAAALALQGCVVSKSKYEMAMAEAESARTELERIRSQKAALDQQVKSLKDLNSKLSGDAELVSAELQRVKESREKERTGVEGRVKELEQKVKEVVGQNRSLRQEYEDMKHHNEALKSTVARYQKELKERPKGTAAPAATPTPGAPRASLSVPPSPSAGALPPVPQPPASVPTPPTAALPKAPAGVTAVNINTASANDMVLFLGMSREVAEKVISNRPYKLKGELVAKNIMPKTSFDLIKDRITTSQ
jgi:DNA uptake protein ComE-like DNA-binding protein